MPPSPLKVVIVGAGIGGLACAIASKKEGLDAVVLEKTKELTALGAGIQIPPNASRIWHHYGVLDHLREFSLRPAGNHVRRWKDGELLCIRNINGEVDERWPWLSIHRADYQRELVQEAGKLGVEVRLGAEVVDLDFEKTEVVLRSGERVRGDVIIGADGLHSHLRSLLLGHPSPPLPTGDLAYRGTFSLSTLRAMNDPRVDELCKKDVVTMWFGPDSHAVFYPFKGGETFNLVMTQLDDLPEGVRKEQGDLEEMKAMFEGWDPVFQKLLSAFPAVLKWKMMHHYELESGTKNNTVLLGDACHPSLPYQAQGAALAVEDGAILATLLGLYHKHQVTPSASSSSSPSPTISLTRTLALYESIQKKRTTHLHAGTLINQHMYHLPDGPEQESRDRLLKSATWKELPEGEEEDWIWVDVRYLKGVVGRDAIGDAVKGWEGIMKEMDEGEDS